MRMGAREEAVFWGLLFLMMSLFWSELIRFGDILVRSLCFFIAGYC
jgi:hypothetical protein